MSRLPALGWLVLALLSLAACRGCSQPVAELLGADGRVERDHGGQRGQFAGAARGDKFYLGDGLRTGQDGRARLGLSPDGLALVEPNTLLRFLPEQSGKAHDRIALEEGTVSIESATLDLEVHTPLAIARLARQGKLQVSAAADGVRFDVLVGRVAIDHDGGTEELVNGQSLSLPPGGQEPAPPRPVDVAQVPTPLPDAGAPAADEAAGAGEPSLVHRGRPDLPLPLENAVLHVPAPPAHVQVALPPCDEGARIEVATGRRTPVVTPPAGASDVTLSLEVGTHRVRVRCGEVLERDVSVRVQRDPGTQELPRSAQRIDVEADGRKYTVHYQNVLPAVTFVWPKAPAAGPYTLAIEGARKSVRLPGPKAARELRPGELPEGEYRFWFERAGDERTRESTLRIVFDNTARSAYLAEPRGGEVAAGPTVTVSGGALAQSEVSVGDVRLPLDAQGRFRGEVPLAPEVNSVAVRVRHPLAGVHYYLRRVR